MIGEFATIIGLLSAFSSGRTGDKQIEMNEFMTWLSEHNHEDIKNLIEVNQTTTVSIKAILKRGLIDVHRKLDDVSDRIAILASRSDGIQGLAASYASAALSEQALEILVLMENEESEYFLLSNELSAKEQRLVLCPGPNYLCRESRFIQDDLLLMIDLGLLVQRYNGRGDTMYYYTRAASKLVKSIT